MALTRLRFVQQAVAGIGLLSLPEILSAKNNKFSRGLKIVCVGAHPDDPESGCGGTLAKLKKGGNEVTIIYLTRGEAGIPGKTAEEAAVIRTGEATAACAVLKVKPLFAGQVDGDTLISNQWVDKFRQLVEQEDPDIVFTHWPVDSHKDHQVASLLSTQAWIRSKKKFGLYFFEVCTGEQTTLFRPTDYVDITAEQNQKRKAVFCHTSQDPAGIYECGHAAMEDFRGREIGVRAAEAFVQARGILPFPLNK